MAGQPSTSRADELYRRLRTDILSGRHAPGSKLHSASLCAQYGISSGVLREALPRLAGEGLAVAEPQRGYRVADITPEDLHQLTEARVLIESETLRQSIEHGDVAFESALIAAHHTMSRIDPVNPDGGIRVEWLAAHSAFHHALLASSPNVRLVAIADSLRDATEVYRRWSSHASDEPGRDVAAEHCSLMEATIAGDADRAVAGLSTHIQRSAEALLRGRDAAAGAQATATLIERI